MTQPEKYNLSTDFSDSEKNGKEPSGTNLDNEFTQVSKSINQTIDNLGLIQRDDGKLANSSVTKDSLDPGLYQAITNIENTINDSIPQATETIKGGSMLASDADIIEGTNDNKIVTPKHLKAIMAPIKVSQESNAQQLSDLTTSINSQRQLKNISGNKSDFPAMGNSEVLYIDDSANLIYRWDSEAGEYKKLTMHDVVINQLFDVSSKLDLLESKQSSDMGIVTQRVDSNEEKIATKASKYAEPIAIAEVSNNGAINYSRGISHVTKTGTGRYSIFLEDSLKGKDVIPITNTKWVWAYSCFSVYKDEGKISLDFIGHTAAYTDAHFNLIVLERQGD